MHRVRASWILAALLLGVAHLCLAYSELNHAPRTRSNAACTKGSSINRNVSTVALAQLLAFEANVDLPCLNKCFVGYALLLSTNKEQASSRSIKQAITSGYNLLSLQHIPQQQQITATPASFSPAAASVVVACHDPTCTATPASFAILQNQFIAVAAQAKKPSQLSAFRAKSLSNAWFYGFDDLSDNPGSMVINITHKPLPDVADIRIDSPPVPLQHTASGAEANEPAYNKTHSLNPLSTIAMKQDNGKVGGSDPMASKSYMNSFFIWMTRCMLLVWLGAVDYGRRQWRLKAAAATACTG